MLKLSFTHFPTLETDRLILREHTLEDAQTWFELRHNPDVMRYIDRDSPKDIEEVEGYINGLITGFEQGESMGWAIALKDNPAQMIGNVVKLHSIEANINPQNEASRRLLLKQGFVKEPYFKEDYYFNGKFLDSEIYSLVSDINRISREV